MPWKDKRGLPAEHFYKDPKKKKIPSYLDVEADDDNEIKRPPPSERVIRSIEAYKARKKKAVVDGTENWVELNKTAGRTVFPLEPPPPLDRKSDFDFDNTSNIAYSNTTNPPTVRRQSDHGFIELNTLEKIDRELDNIINYIGLYRRVPVPASGDYADRYYDKLEQDKRRLGYPWEERDPVPKATHKIKPRKFTKTQYMINISEKIMDISRHIGALNQIDFRPTSTGGSSNFPYIYKYKKAMDRWVFDIR